MKNRLKFMALIVLLMVQGCNNTDCEGLDCFTEPTAFVFEIVDQETGENLFTNGTYTPGQIEVLNSADNSKRDFSFIAENGRNLISIGSIGWETEIADVVLKIDGEDILNLYVDTERVTENCCNFSKYNKINVENAVYEFDKQTFIYTIYV
jgi:hypothetical protein